MSKDLILITGISGSGKTTLADRYSCSKISNDTICTYKPLAFNFQVFKDKFLENPEESIFVLDAFVFQLDPDFKIFKEILGDNLNKIVLICVYVDQNVLSEMQIAKKAKYGNSYVLPEDLEIANRQRSKQLYICVEGLYARKCVDYLFYLYRKGDDYIFQTSAEHFLKDLESE